MKEKGSLKNTRLFLKLFSSFVFKCFSEAVAIMNLVKAGFFSRRYGFLTQYLSMHLSMRCDQMDCKETELLSLRYPLQRKC